ncbi:hypothetical protein FH972_001195 [Carpinus fangiana]|uniref:Uncharacterized protein n=1 Tax=Carpinus fangiana TaxID=176857 RepID=A0A5N6QB76_9ROSI|nr:hypothetical protein FH972_001195 [Carpinus fangiana]
MGSFGAGFLDERFHVFGAGSTATGTAAVEVRSGASVAPSFSFSRGHSMNLRICSVRGEFWRDREMEKP